jgi:hypothetical protein
MKYIKSNLRYYHGICLEGLRKTMKTSIRTARLRDHTNMKQEFIYSLIHLFKILHEERKDKVLGFCFN